MRILHLCRSLGNGGAEKMLTRLAIEQTSQGHDVALVLLSGPNDFREELQKAQVRVISCGKKLNILSIFKAYYFSRKLRPEFIFSWMYLSNLLAVIYKQLGIRSKVIWNIRNGDLRISGVSALSYISAKICGYCDSLPHRVVYNSVKGLEVHSKFYPNHHIAEVIHNGVDTLEMVPQKNFSRDKLILGSLGRFNDYKDYATLIKLIKMVNSKFDYSVEFVLAGYQISYDNKMLVDLLLEDGVFPENVTLIGPVENKELFFSNIDIFLLHSKSEGSPNVLLEAISYGCFPIITKVGDAPLMVLNQNFTVEPENPGGLYDAVRRFQLLSNNEVKEIINENHRHISEKFTFFKMNEKFSAILEESRH